MKKKYIVLIIVAIILILTLTKCIHTTLTTDFFTAVEQDKIKVIASNGKEFKVIYTLHNFPDESYDLDISSKSGNRVMLFGGDGSGTKNVEIKYLLSYNGVDYYNAMIYYREKLQECLLAYNIVENSIERFYQSIIMFDEHEGETFELFIPAVRQQIIKENKGDYVSAYAERLITDNKEEIVQKLKYFIEHPEDIKCEYYTKYEIVLKCQEILKKYDEDK